MLCRLLLYLIIIEMRLYSKRMCIYTVLLQSLTDEQKFHLSGKVLYHIVYLDSFVLTCCADLH